MNRRDFLVSSGLAAAAGLYAGGAKTAHAGEFTGKIKKAVKYGMVKVGKTPLEKLKLLKDLGYDGVEPNFGEVPIEELAKASEATGLPVHGIVKGWSFDDINTCIDEAKLIGATSVLIVAGKVDEKMPYAQNYTETMEKMKRAGEHAAKQEIHLLVENVWNNFLISPLEMAQYIDEVDNPWVGSYFDIGNVARFGWPEHWIPVLGSRIKKLDVKEFSTKKMNDEGLWKGFDVEIGDGTINWKAVRKELRAIGYEGFATAEVGGGDEKRLADIAARMDKVLDL
ncbi:MAG: sugar phosphate isomerase/epimerase [Candidatus Hydrogenedentes bacterium]|jgi:L-ribulose-5-phosphate 3-epimerase|nr:sugar phosphate isomerase/epimerase [Candidatus Hydrogenedentota bacterium]